MNNLYDMIFKRKSVRMYDNDLHISNEELDNINKYLSNLICLFDIKTSYKIVKKEETNCNRGEYCLLIYSEQKENYLLNIGYMFEQFDLYLSSLNIGCCWYGWGKTNEIKYNDCDFVIMMCFGKCNENNFRKDISKTKRKDINEIWNGSYLDIANVVRYSPSACNSQPWRIISNNNTIEIYRSKDVKGLLKITNGLKNKYNKIDMGIFLCILEITLNKFNYSFERIVFKEEDSDLIKVAKYTIK